MKRSIRDSIIEGAAAGLATGVVVLPVLLLFPAIWRNVVAAVCR